MLILFAPFYTLAVPPSSDPEQPELVMASSTTRAIPPYSWIDPCTGERLGYVSHMIRGIFENLGISYRYLPAVDSSSHYYDTVKQQLESGAANALGSVIPGQVDAPLVLTRRPVSSIQLGIISHLELLQSAVTKEKLKLYAGGISLENTTSKDSLASYLHQQSLTVKTFATDSATYGALQAGSIDYIINNKSLLAIEALSQKHGLTVTPLDDMTIPLHFGITSSSPYVDLIPQIDANIEKITANESPERLKLHYMRLWLNSRHCAPADE